MLKPHYILDSHIHMFDPLRAESVPWPVQGDLIYKQYLSEDIQTALQPLHINQAIAVEASPWFSDNQWLLDQVNQSAFFAGCVGHLNLMSPEFSQQFEQFISQKKYLGIRYGNLWDCNLKQVCTEKLVLQHLKELAKAHKTLDVANPDLELLEAVFHIKKQVPELTVIIDHLPNFYCKEAEQTQYFRLLKQLAPIENTYVKFSEIVQLQHGQKRFEVERYRQRLDQILEHFGVSRLMFGSDFPNSEYLGPIEKIMQVVQDYCIGMSQDELDQLFYKTGSQAYSLSIKVENKNANNCQQNADQCWTGS